MDALPMGIGSISLRTKGNFPYGQRENIPRGIGTDIVMEFVQVSRKENL